MRITISVSDPLGSSANEVSNTPVQQRHEPPSPDSSSSSDALPSKRRPVLRSASPPRNRIPPGCAASGIGHATERTPADPDVIYSEPALIAVPQANSLVPREYCTVDTTSSDRTLALWIATAEDDIDLMRALLKGNVEIDRLAPPGVSLLHLGCMSDSPFGDPVDHSFAGTGLIADADRRQIVEAVQIQILCEAGASPDLRDHLGRTPLHIACASDKRMLARALLNNCADPNLPDRSQRTSLHLACLNGHSQTVVLLLAFGANPNLKDDAGRTPISIARDRNLSCVQDLLSVASKLVLRESGSGTVFPALHQAVIGNNRHKIQMMLNNGADPDIRDGKDRTPLLRACTQGHLEIAEILIDGGANVNASYRENMTVLHFAVMMKNFEMVAMLLRKGANPLAANDEGVTSLDIAAQCGPAMLKFIANRLSSEAIADDQQK